MTTIKLTIHDLNIMILTHLKDQVISDFKCLASNDILLVAVRNFNTQVKIYYKDEKDDDCKQKMIKNYTLPMPKHNIIFREDYDRSAQIFLFAKKIFIDNAVSEIITSFPDSLVPISNKRILDEKELKLAIVDIFQSMIEKYLNIMTECKTILSYLYVYKEEHEKLKSGNTDKIYDVTFIEDIDNKITINYKKNDEACCSYLAWHNVFDYILEKFMFPNIDITNIGEK